jgi:hypothetical protein
MLVFGALKTMQADIVDGRTIISDEILPDIVFNNGIIAISAPNRMPCVNGVFNRFNGGFAVDNREIAFHIVPPVSDYLYIDI